MGSMTPEHLLQTARETMEAAELCFLITMTEFGPPRARLMQPFGPEQDMTVWLGASPESRKVAEILKDDRVTLAYSYEPEAAYVTLSGKARIESDVATRKRYWRDSFHQFWPGGPGDSNYVVIRFTPSRIELINIEREVAPQPFGLQPAVLTRADDEWNLEE